MIDSDFDDIFAELVDEDQPKRIFLEALTAVVPGSGAMLIEGEAGRRLWEGAAFVLAPDVEAELVRELTHELARESEGGAAWGAAAVGVPVEDGAESVAAGPEAAEIGKAPAPLVSRPLGGGWVYALPLPQFAARIFWWLPLAADLSRQPETAGLLRLAVERALGEEQRREEAAREEQYQRQIEVLKKQHGKLIEDNYRQYRINQEREQQYARELESEIARQTAELREANRRLEESSRLKSEFLANMSHELRTPMNAIIGFAELLAETSLDGDQEEYCRTIRQASSSLLALINDILDLAKIEAGKLELEIIPFELDELLAGATAIFRLAAREKGVSLRCERGPDLPDRLLGDSHRLRQVLINLLGNALKFTEQGEVVLSVTRQPAVGQKIGLCLAVRDSGIGIPADRLDAVFEKFTQADGSTTRRFGGTGLGLAICRQLVELMGGRIQVSSREGEGSTFSFTVELAALEPEQAVAPASQSAAAGSGAAPAPARSLRVLLVEDNPVNQRLASLMLGKQGCRVTVAADGIEALAKLGEEEFDLVFMDVQMPRMDGLTVTRRIRELENEPAAAAAYPALAGRQTPLPIIGLTAHARKEDEQECYAAGMNAFLSKPIVKAKLLSILEKF